MRINDYLCKLEVIMEAGVPSLDCKLYLPMTNENVNILKNEDLGIPKNENLSTPKNDSLSAPKNESVSIPAA